MSRALEDERLDILLKQRIRIITIGGAALISSFPPYKSVENLINEYDFLPLFAHSTCNVETMFEDHPLLNSIIQGFIDIKRIMQEDVLKISSHKIPALADRILSAMQCSWEAQPSSERIGEAFCKDIIKSSKRNLTSLRAPQKGLENFIYEATLACMTHLLYKIEILKTERSSLLNYFEDCHSVNSYLPRLSQLIIGYVENHDNIHGPLAAN